MTNDSLTPRVRFAQALDAAHLSITSTFVPWHVSRNVVYRNGIPSTDPTDWSLNWRVTMWKTGRPEPILTTDWMAGIGHAPGYKNHDVRAVGRRYSLAHAAILHHEVTTGRTYKNAFTSGGIIEIDRESVCASLFLDAAVVDYLTMETWADDFGYDPDSRKAEKIYNNCRDLAARMLTVIDRPTFDRLRSLAVDL